MQHLHRNCCQVVHYDLGWNPATIESAQGEWIGNKNSERRDPPKDSACNKAIERIRGRTEDGNERATRHRPRAHTDPKSRRHVATEHECHLNSLDRILPSHQKPTQIGHQHCRTRTDILFVLFHRAEKQPSNSGSRRPQRKFLRNDLALEVHPKTWFGRWSPCRDGKRLNPPGFYLPRQAEDKTRAMSLRGLTWFLFPRKHPFSNIFRRSWI